MNKPFLAIATLLASLLGACAGTDDVVTVLTYNIHHGEGTDGVFDLHRLARIIRDSNADIVALQEVDVGTERANGVDQASELARLTGMERVFGEAIPYRGGSYGDAMLTRLPIQEPLRWPLPAQPNHEKRVAVGGVLSLPSGKPIRFLSTHFDHTSDPADRVTQTHALLALAFPTGSDPLPTLLLGDLNAGPRSEPLRLLGQHFASAAPGGIASFPSDDPQRAIDWILFSPTTAWEVLDVAALDEPIASDHAPVCATLRLSSR